MNLPLAGWEVQLHTCSLLTILLPGYLTLAMLNDVCSDPEYLFLCFCVHCLPFPLQRTGTTFAPLLSAGASPVFHEVSEITSTDFKISLVMLA